MTLSEMLSETVDGARQRERCEFERNLVETNREIVLFGAGRLGHRVLAALRKAGVSTIGFADNDPRLNGSRIDGIEVVMPVVAARQWGARSLFVVTTFLPNSGIQNRIRELRSLGCSHVCSFLSVGWRFDGILPHFGADLPSKLLQYKNEMRHLWEILDDAVSRETFRQELAWRLRAEFQYPAPPAADQYFPIDLIRPNSREYFVDGGAFDGDTLRSAKWRFSNVVAIEPDQINAKKLRAASGPETQVHEVLLGDAIGSARFNGTGTMASSRSEQGTAEVRVTTLDRLLEGQHPTFIKLDIEGDELSALYGARETLIREQPIVAACVYHKPEDLWNVPLFLKETLPEHKIFFRAHQNDGFELVVYAVPPWRCA